MKKRIIIFIFIVVIIGMGFSFKRFSNNINYSTVASGFVISKDINPYTITVRKFSKNTNEKEEVKIIIEDENVWNLVEKERDYFVTYFWKNNEMPVLGQIKMNEEFSDIQKTR